MNKTFLKVLKYLGVALLGAFIGIGALIGISSCEAKKVQSANAETNSIRGGIYRTNSYVDITNYYRVVPNSFTFNNCTIRIRGNNYFYSDDFGNKEIDTIDIYCPLFSQDGQRYFSYDQGRIRFTTAGESESQLLFDQDFGDYDYYFGTDDFTRIFISSSSSIEVVLTSPIDYIENTIISYFYEDFNVIFSPIETSSFTFYDSWNYNAPYGSTTDDLFIQDVAFTSSNSSLVITKSYNFIYGFISNGEFYNSIEVKYFNGIGARYLSGNDVKTNTSEGFGYFSALLYVNNITNHSRLVCRRVTVNKLQGNELQNSLTSGSTWVNNNYQKLLFLGSLSNDENTSLSQFNNNLSVNGISSTGGDIGLSNVFTLIAHAFASWIPIFNIQIVPGVTVGLLMFLPLITGIIILIVWIVKR